MTRILHKFVFNFAASYSGGGYKRLHEYAKWFNANGGAWFVINPRCAILRGEFPNNGYFVASQSRVRRLLNDCGYLGAIEEKIGKPELYYSYGVPLYGRFGNVNWFHLSNVLPLQHENIPLSVVDRWKAAYLGMRIRRGLALADVISAESNFSLSLIDPCHSRKLFLSVNGGDDEVHQVHSGSTERREEIATVLGTQRYKAMGDSVSVFEMLKERNPELRLMIFGNPALIPRSLRSRADLVVRGILDRRSVMDCLRRSKFFISTTRIENSYNAASEGIFLAEESFISDIGPHRELLVNMPFDELTVPGVAGRLLHIRASELSGANLRRWDDIIVKMIDRFRMAITGNSHKVI
ncbi:MAG: hypothetical protein ACYDBZ_04100 [Steroidobacteraceae bacterium]